MLLPPFYESRKYRRSSVGGKRGEERPLNDRMAVADANCVHDRVSVRIWLEQIAGCALV